MKLVLEGIPIYFMHNCSLLEVFMMVLIIA